MESNSPKIPNQIMGMIRSASVEDFIADPDSVELSLNMHSDRIGATTVRKGLSEFTNATLASGAISLHQWSQAGTTNRELIAQQGLLLRELTAGVWTTIRTNTVAGRVRSSQMNNLTFFVNGNAGDDPGSYDGSTYSVGVDDLPKGDYINSGFEKRVWVGDKSSGKVYYTDQIPFGTAVTGGSEFIFFNAENGQAMTGLFQSQKSLLVFYPDNIFRIYGATSSDPYPAYFVGTYSQESIVKAKDGIYFHHSSGFYKFQYDGQPQEISRGVIDFIQAIPRSSYDTVFGWVDDDHVYWSVGNLTLQGVTYKNVVFRYTISSKVWTIYSYFASGSRTLTAAFTYDDAINLNRLVAISDGKIAVSESGTTDLGEPIFYELITRWISFTESQSEYQEVTQMAAIHINGAGANLEAQTDKDVPDKWAEIGTYDENYVTLFQSIAGDVLPFNRIRFRTRGTSTGTPPIFTSLEILNLDELGKYYN
jgi:hypothetical protein